jgi:hypothetical protein
MSGLKALLSCGLARDILEVPGSGDRRIVANSLQIGRLGEASGYLALKNRESQFAIKRLAPQHGFELKIRSTSAQVLTMRMCIL